MVNKKQVGALLKVIGKDDARPVLKLVKIDRWKDDVVMFATDGYMVALITLDDGAWQLVGKTIRREAIEKWHKLATGKSRLTGEELVAVSNSDYADNNGYSELVYPKWQAIIERGFGEPTGRVAFNGEYAKVIQDLSGEKFLQWQFGGPMDQIRAITDSGVFIIMPVKV